MFWYQHVEAIKLTQQPVMSWAPLGAVLKMLGPIFEIPRVAGSFSKKRLPFGIRQQGRGV